MATKAAPKAKAADLSDAIRSLAGVLDVGVDIVPIGDVKGDDLRLPGPYALLPHASLLRTKGGLKGEVLVTHTVSFARMDDGWRGVEFLAWWARDCARTGVPVQLRPEAMPPSSVASLCFVLELFVVPRKKESAAAASARVVTELAEALKLAKVLYG